MYSDAKKQKRAWLIWLIAALLIAAVVLLAVRNNPGRDLSEESAAAICAAVERSARQCYVVEGVYPPDLNYLTENYGLQVNTSDFYVTYNAFASNVPPTVIVRAK